MESSTQKPGKTVAAFIHLSTFSQFFFPLGNFIFPLVLWMAQKKDDFVDRHGRQALNFQISLYLYSVFLLSIGVAGMLLIGFSTQFDHPFYFNDDFELIGTPADAMPLIAFGVIILLFLLTLFVLNIYAVISATVKASEGEEYHYPLCFNFITSGKQTEDNQSKNEQSNNNQNGTL